MCGGAGYASVVAELFILAFRRLLFLDGNVQENNIIILVFHTLHFSQGSISMLLCKCNASVFKNNQITLQSRLKSHNSSPTSLSHDTLVLPGKYSSYIKLNVRRHNLSLHVRQRVKNGIKCHPSSIIKNKSWYQWWSKFWLSFSSLPFTVKNSAMSPVNLHGDPTTVTAVVQLALSPSNNSVSKIAPVVLSLTGGLGYL